MDVLRSTEFGSEAVKDKRQILKVAWGWIAKLILNQDSNLFNVDPVFYSYVMD